MNVPSRLSLVTLGVDDVARSVAFYRALGWEPSPASVEGEVAFFPLQGGNLAVWGRDSLGADAGVTPPSSPSGAVALAMNVEGRDLVQPILDTAQAAGASILKPATETEWGGVNGYFADPDGHVWEVAWNPGWPLAEDGTVRIP